jgi:hypothetical protein
MAAATTRCPRKFCSDLAMNLSSERILSLWTRQKVAVALVTASS